MSPGWAAAAGVLLTLALYLLAKRLNAAYRRWWLAPILIVPALLWVLLSMAGITYDAYNGGAHWLAWMLGPATVAFAIPVYEQRHVIRRHWLPLVGGVVVGMTVAVGSSVLLARLFALPQQVALSLVPRSISTPFAMLVASSVGGEPQLAAVFVIFSGLIGLLVGGVCLRMPLRSRLARGALLGAGAHGIGSAKARELGPQEGVIASLAMLLSGLLLVCVAPLLHLVL